MTDDYQPDKAEIDAMMEELVFTGVLVWEGMDDTGDPIYRLGEHAAEIDPEFVAVWMAAQRAEIEEALMELVEAGLVTFEYPDVELEPVFNLTDLGRRVAEERYGVRDVDPGVGDLL